MSAPARTIELPRPQRTGRCSLEETLATRRSVREFTDEPLTTEQLSQLSWATHGVTHREGLRTAPSAGALYPLELYESMPEGVYHYDPRRHRLTLHQAGDLRPALFEAGLRQECLLGAPAVFVMAAVFERTEQKYGRRRAPRYVFMEAGHAAENLLLQAVGLGLGGVPVGAFEDARTRQVLRLPADQKVVYLVSVGHPRD